MNKTPREKRIARKRRIRAQISGTADRPRLAVFRSLTSVSVQLIDDEKHATIASAREKELSGATGTKSERASQVGMLIAKKAKEKGISVAVFDRAGYRYHGRVKAVADGAREGGLEF